MGYYVEVERGVKIYVEDIGTGQPVLLLHGWPVDHRMYEYQTSQLPKYGYRCITMDIRGFGKSDAPWHGYDYDRLADDVLAVIRSLCLDSDVTLAGFSMGGAIAIRYMSRHAGYKVNKLLLFGAAAPSFTKRPGFPYGMTAEQVNAFIEQTNNNRPDMLEGFGTIFFAKPVTPSFAHWFQSLGLAATSHGTSACLVSLRDEDLSNDLAAIQTPTYIFHGVLDQVCPFPFAIEMHKGIRNSQLIRFDDSGHGLFYDQLDAFNRCLLYALSHPPHANMHDAD